MNPDNSLRDYDRGRHAGAALWGLLYGVAAGFGFGPLGGLAAALIGGGGIIAAPHIGHALAWKWRKAADRFPQASTWIRKHLLRQRLFFICVPFAFTGIGLGFVGMQALGLVVSAPFWLTGAALGALRTYRQREAVRNAATPHSAAPRPVTTPPTEPNVSIELAVRGVSAPSRTPALPAMPEGPTRSVAPATTARGRFEGIG